MRIATLLLYCAFLLRPLGAADSWFFVQMSDPQFGMYTENRDFAQETANFEFAVATVNRWKPAFVVITGDLINKAGDPAQSAEYHRIAARLDRSIPLYNVAGNHDVTNNPTRESLAAYRERFGPDYYTFRSGNLAGFILNSSIIQHPEAVRDEYDKQLKWLRSELDKARKDGVAHLVVFQHIPFFLKSPDEPDQYFNIPLEQRKEYLAVLHEYGVHNVIAGHYHRNAVGVDGSLMMITSGPVGKPVEEGESGMRIAIVSDKVIRTDYVTFSRLPNRVDPAKPLPQ